MNLHLFKFRYNGDTWLGRACLIVAQDFEEAQRVVMTYVSKNGRIVETCLQTLEQEPFDAMYILPKVEPHA